MKREFLKGLLGESATKEIIDSIMNENGNDIEAEKNKSIELQKQLNMANTTIQTYENQLEQLKNSPDNPETLKATITQLQLDNQKLKDDNEKEVKQIKIENALTLALTNGKAKNAKAVKALLDFGDDVVLNDDGTIKGLDEKIKELQKSDSYLFDLEPNKKKIDGAIPGSDPASNQTIKKPSEMTYEDFVMQVENENN